jgi:hypothetical protein
MCTIGVFMISHILSTLLGYRGLSEPPIWRRITAVVRYLSYRGFHVKALRWNSAPLGILLLGLVGIVFFFCKSPKESSSIIPTTQNLYCHRHGLGSETILLARYHVWWFSTPGNEIWVDGTCMHAICLVRQCIWAFNSKN